MLKTIRLVDVLCRGRVLKPPGRHTCPRACSGGRWRMTEVE
jgi:hypothetical protein